MSEPVTDQFGNTGYWIHNTTGQICDPAMDDLRQCFFSIDTRAGAGSRADAGLSEINRDTLLDNVRCSSQSDPQMCVSNVNCAINPARIVTNQDVSKSMLESNIRNPSDSWWSGRWKDGDGNWVEDNVCDLDGVSCDTFVDSTNTTRNYIQSVDLPESYFQPLGSELCQRKTDAVSTQSAWEQAQQQQCSVVGTEDRCNNSYCDWTEAGNVCYRSSDNGDSTTVDRYPIASTELQCGHCQDVDGNLIPTHTEQGTCEQSANSSGQRNIWVGATTSSAQVGDNEISYEWTTRNQHPTPYTLDADSNQGYCETSTQVTQTTRDQCDPDFFSVEELSTSFTPLYEVNAGQCLLNEDYRRPSPDSDIDIFDTFNNGFVSDVRSVDNVNTFTTDAESSEDYFSEQSLARATGVTRTMDRDNQSTGVKGILETSALSDYYFSDENIKVIQDTIRYRVYQETNLVVDYQSPQELFIVMRSIILQHANFKVTGNELINELRALNSMVVSYCVGEVASNVVQYQGYLDDLERLPTPIDRPTFSDREINNTYDISRFIGFPEIA